MFDDIIRVLLRPVTNLLHLLIKEMRMNQAEVIASLNLANDGLAEVDTKVTALTDTVNKVGAETSSLLAEIKTLQDEVVAAHTTSPALLAAIEAVSARVNTISGHVTAATTAAAAVDAAVPDKVATDTSPPNPIPVEPVPPEITPVDPAPTPDPVL